MLLIVNIVFYDVIGNSNLAVAGTACPEIGKVMNTFELEASAADRRSIRGVTAVQQRTCQLDPAFAFRHPRSRISAETVIGLASILLRYRRPEGRDPLIRAASCAG